MIRSGYSRIPYVNRAPNLSSHIQPIDRALTVVSSKRFTQVHHHDGKFSTEFRILLSKVLSASWFFGSHFVKEIASVARWAALARVKEGFHLQSFIPSHFELLFPVFATSRDKGHDALSQSTKLREIKMAITFIVLFGLACLATDLRHRWRHRTATTWRGDK